MAVGSVASAGCTTAEVAAPVVNPIASAEASVAPAADPERLVAPAPMSDKASAPAPTAETAPPVWEAAATRYLDARTDRWLSDPPQVRNHFPCALSCHTTHPYLFVRPRLGESDLSDQARARLLERVDQPGAWSDQTGFYGRPGGRTWRRSLATEAVLNANALALHDHARGRPLQDDTLRALDRMWEVQRPDGAWSWLDFSYQPWEAGNDDWGAALAAMAAGLAPASYRSAHADDLDRLRRFLRRRSTDARDPMTAHDELALLWAGRMLDDLVDPTTRARIVERTAALQREDGGWRLNDLLAPRVPARAISEPDGYATGLATFVLCTEPRATEATARGLTWLRTHQRDDGSWPAWSPNRDRTRSHLHLRDAAAAYAVLALAACSPSREG